MSPVFAAAGGDVWGGIASGDELVEEETAEAADCDAALVEVAALVGVTTPGTICANGICCAPTQLPALRKKKLKPICHMCAKCLTSGFLVLPITMKKLSHLPGVYNYFKYILYLLYRFIDVSGLLV